MSSISPPLDYVDAGSKARKTTGRKLVRSNAARSASVPDLTLEAISRTFYAEAVKYGFRHLDYVRFVNLILDHAMRESMSRAERSQSPTHLESSADVSEGVTTALPISGDRVTVRAMNGEPDIQHVELWTRDGLGRRFLLSRTSSRQSALRQIVRDPSSIFGIVEAPTTEPIGCVAFLNYDQAQQKAELRKLIGNPAYRGQGLAREASALWIQYGIKVLGLKKIYLNTFETDIRNIRLNERLGFKVEGVLRGEVVVSGVRRDVLRMALLADEM